MITSTELIQEIRNFCKANANEGNIIKYQRYFKEKYNGYGLSTLQINQEAKEVLKRADIALEVVLEAMPLFLKDNKFEEISCGLMVVNGLSKEYSKKTFVELGNLYKLGITNWAHADVLGMYILPKFFEQKIVDINDFKSWLKSPFKFQRRSVPVTFIKPLKANKDCKIFIDFIKPLVNDNEREVHQGVGWFLREAWKINSTVTEKYLNNWNNTAPRLIIQYACEKMSANEKLRFKRQK